MDGCVSFKLVNNNHRTEEERLKSEDAFGGQVRWGEGVIGNYPDFLREEKCQHLQPGFKDVIREPLIF